MAAKKKVDGRTKEARARKAASEKRRAAVKPGCRLSATKGGRPVGGRLAKLGDVVRIVKGAEKHALGVIGNEDGAHWIVFEDRSHTGIRIRKTSVRLATLDERHIHLRKLVAIDVAIAVYVEGKYEVEAPAHTDDDDDDVVEDVTWVEGAFPESIAAEWGLTKAENREIEQILLDTHAAHGGEAYHEEKTVMLSTGKQFSFEQVAPEDATVPGSEGEFEYKPLAVIAVGAGKSASEEQEPTIEKTLASMGATDGRGTDAVESALGA